MSRSGAKTVVCTIASANYLARVRVLMASLAVHHPDWERHLLLVDEVAGRFDPDSEAFEVTPVSALPLAEPRRLFFRYSRLELATAVKPPFLRDLFGRTGCERVVYLDPDVQLIAPLTPVVAALDAGATICLTPHVLEVPPSDGKEPSAEGLRRAGLFNLGFIALARHPMLDAFLAQWWAHTERDCRIDFARGLFLDQRCLDDLPARHPGVSALAHRGCNVAYWNLGERPLVADPTAGQSRLLAGPDPLLFFHWSGFDPNSPDRLSRFQDRFRLRDLPVVADLCDRYRQALLAAGEARCQSFEYAFDRFRDRTPIIDAARSLYRTSESVQQDGGDDPFALGAGYFNEPVDFRTTARDGDKEARPLVSRLLHAIWAERDDLRRAFPEPDGRDRRDFAWWFVTRTAPELGLPEAFVAPVRASLGIGGPAANGASVGLAASRRVRRRVRIAQAADLLKPLARFLSPAFRCRLRALRDPPAR
jgi:hypothetical protein